MLMPAVDFRDTESAELQSHFVRCGGLRLLLEIVTNKTFMAQRDNTLKRWALALVRPSSGWIAKREDLLVFQSVRVQSRKICLGGS